jgi:hypothetical protein
MAQPLNTVSNIYIIYLLVVIEGYTMLRYKQVSGNSNVAFEYPLIALLIKDPEAPDFSPYVSMEDETTFNNWMYIRKKRA